MMSGEAWSGADEVFSSDSCLTGCGGFWKGKYFHSIFPEFILKQKMHIAGLEMLSLVVCSDSHFYSSSVRNSVFYLTCDT